MASQENGVARATAHLAIERINSLEERLGLRLDKIEERLNEAVQSRAQLDVLVREMSESLKRIGSTLEENTQTMSDCNLRIIQLENWRERFTKFVMLVTAPAIAAVVTWIVSGFLH